MSGSNSVLDDLVWAGALEGLGGAGRTPPRELSGLIYSEEGLDITAGAGGAARFERVRTGRPRGGTVQFNNKNIAPEDWSLAGNWLELR